MRRDLNLIKRILLALEEDKDPFDWKSEDIVNNINTIEYCYHIKLLQQAGLIEAIDMSSESDPDWIPISLTWQGHEFLDAAKNETAWNKVKEKAKKEGGAMPFSIIKELLLVTIRGQFGL